jgi:mannonate dehydratase
MNSAEFCRRLQPLQMFFVEDVLAPENLEWYQHIRKICTTPQAVGELFTHPTNTTRSSPSGSSTSSAAASLRHWWHHPG